MSYYLRIARLPIVAALLSLLPLDLLAAERPNLLLVTIDTLRSDHVACYGYANGKTPVLDRLAAEGIRFKNAFSPVPLTLPAHTSLLTGDYPVYHGVRDNSGYVLAASQTTIAEQLKASGYATAAFVGAFVLDSKFGLDQGFDLYWDDFDLSRYENVSPGYIQRPADQVVDRVLEWLDSRPPEPFFAWVHLYDPHDPYTPPEPYASRHPGRPYDGEIEFADANLGRLLDRMRADGLYEKTVIVAAGDHGESLGEHGESKHGYFIYDATLKVPLILRVPEWTSPGQVVEDNVSLVDVYPTVLQLLRIERSGQKAPQGSGLLSLLLKKGRSTSSPLYAESYYPYLQFGWSPLRCIIRDKLKLVLAPSPELYDLEADPGERRNLYAERRDVANSLESDLQELLRRFGPPEGLEEAARPVDAQTMERLRSLGYVSLASANVKDVEYKKFPNPKDRIDLYNRVLDLFELSSSGKHREVIPEYRSVLAAEPSLKIVRYKLGQAYYHTGNFAAAAEEFKLVIEQGGEASLATFDLAQAYLRLNRPADAILGFERTIAIDPAHYRARANLGVLYKNQGRLTDAILQLEAARELAPGSTFVLNNLGVAYAMNRNPEKGLSTLREASRLEPENAAIHANLAAVLKQLGRNEEAAEELRRARSLDPKLFKP